MNRICLDCNKEYDDARCLTYCPHDPLMPDEDMERKIFALKIFDLRKKIRITSTGEEGIVVAVLHNGYVDVKGDSWRKDGIDPTTLEIID